MDKMKLSVLDALRELMLSNEGGKFNKGPPDATMHVISLEPLEKSKEEDDDLSPDEDSSGFEQEGSYEDDERDKEEDKKKPRKTLQEFLKGV